MKKVLKLLVLFLILAVLYYSLRSVGAHFWQQAGINLDKLSAGAEHDKGFNPFRWVIGGGAYIFIALCQTGVWWVNHGSATEWVLLPIGLLGMGLLVLSQMGNLSFGGGGGGGGGKAAEHH